MADDSRVVIPKPGPPRKQVSTLAGELGVPVIELIAYLFKVDGVIPEPEDLVAPRLVQLAREHFRQIPSRAPRRPSGRTRPGRRSDQRVRSGRAERSPEHVFATRIRQQFPHLTLSREDVSALGLSWAKENFTPEGAGSWWAAGLGPWDAVLAGRAARIGLRPSHLALHLNGRQVSRRVRDGENLAQIYAQLLQLEE